MEEAKDGRATMPIPDIPTATATATATAAATATATETTIPPITSTTATAATAATAGDEKYTQTTDPTATPFLSALIAGGIAGTVVDVTLFPIDTIKTRLQSPRGLMASGGFRGVYRGLGATALGSAPGAALFFSTYESAKPIVAEFLGRRGVGCDDDHDDGDDEAMSALGHMLSASLGEAAACLVRVPTEVIKSSMQVGASPDGSQTLSATFRRISNEGGLYRGYGITLLREVPFAFVQFPIYERAKIVWANRQGHDVSATQAAACGSFSGAIAAAVTTPLDVIKTRLMLGVDKDGVPYRGAVDALRRTVRDEGGSPWVLMRGIQPRVMWISIGGFVFFGSYEFSRSVLVHL